MALIIWKCLECKSQTHHKGLCRECTEYDGEGKIVNPIRRVRVNNDGTVYTPSKKLKLPLNPKDRFKRTKKPTKKQMQKIEAEFTKYIPSKENQVMLMGESDDEEE